MDDRTARMMVVGPAVVPLICMLRRLCRESGLCRSLWPRLGQFTDSRSQAASCAMDSPLSGQAYMDCISVYVGQVCSPFER
jgi:hypothetical protein